jgi:uncharacterized protein (TIGR02996 family)
MSIERDLLDAIRNAPKDDNLKLVYADLLDQSDDPKGQILRLSVELRRALEANEQTLRDAWLELLGVQVERREILNLNPGEEVFRCELGGWEFDAYVRDTNPSTLNLVGPDGRIVVELEVTVRGREEDD